MFLIVREDSLCILLTLLSYMRSQFMELTRDYENQLKDLRKKLYESTKRGKAVTCSLNIVCGYYPPTVKCLTVFVTPITPCDAVAETEKATEKQVIMPALCSLLTMLTLLVDTVGSLHIVLTTYCSPCTLLHCLHTCFHR